MLHCYWTPFAAQCNYPIYVFYVVSLFSFVTYCLQLLPPGTSCEQHNKLVVGVRRAVTGEAYVYGLVYLLFISVMRVSETKHLKILCAYFCMCVTLLVCLHRVSVC